LPNDWDSAVAAVIADTLAAMNIVDDKVVLITQHREKSAKSPGIIIMKSFGKKDRIINPQNFAYKKREAASCFLTMQQEWMFKERSPLRYKQKCI